MEDQIPEMNLFMMCKKMDNNATKALPTGFFVRNCRKDELDIWKAMHFDTPELATKYYDFMTRYFNEVYFPKGDLFYQRCVFVCNKDDQPIGTCFLWKAYNTIWTVQWFKVLREYEGNGIGRALLSIVLRSLSSNEYPIFLHTHPSSYRAIKLYSDFGFSLLSDPIVGNRQNDLEECLPILRRYMTAPDFEKLHIIRAPRFFLRAVRCGNIDEF